MSVLDQILASKHEEVAALRRGLGLPALERAAAEAPPARDFAAALSVPGRLAVIAEVKRRSPSKGVLAAGLDPAATAAAYVRGGAAALSVLTDGPFFGGSLEDLRAARGAVAVPVLRKDFTLDAIQVYEARAAGADAVLLVCAALPDDGRLRELRELADTLGMVALVEADDEVGVERALAAGARVIGVTNRDLRTFGEDLAVAERLASRIPDGVVAVAESAIRSREDAERMAAASFDAVLVGEALVRAPDPEAAVRAMAVPRVAALRASGRSG